MADYHFNEHAVPGKSTTNISAADLAGTWADLGPESWMEVMILVQDAEVVNLKSGARRSWSGYIDFAGPNEELVVRNIREV